MYQKVKEERMKCIGVDLHSNRFNICILDEGTSKQRDRFELNDEDLTRLLAAYISKSSWRSHRRPCRTPPSEMAAIKDEK